MVQSLSLQSPISSFIFKCTHSRISIINLELIEQGSKGSNGSKGMMVQYAFQMDSLIRYGSIVQSPNVDLSQNLIHRFRYPSLNFNFKFRVQLRDMIMDVI